MFSARRRNADRIPPPMLQPLSTAPFQSSLWDPVEESLSLSEHQKKRSQTAAITRDARAMSLAGNSVFFARVFSRLKTRTGVSACLLPASTSCDCFLRQISISCVSFSVSFRQFFARSIGEAQAGVAPLECFGGLPGGQKTVAVAGMVS